MSGGVDSSVAAWMLKEQGYEVVGLFMKNWEDDDDSEYCSTRQDWIDAASVADVVGVDIEAVNFAAEYKDRVFAEFLREYQAGRTPNPDVLCNAEIKFKAFLDHAMQLGADLIATGHYARVRGSRRRHASSCSRRSTRTKDQSYFLHRLNQAQLVEDPVPAGRDPEDRSAQDRRTAGAAECGEEGLDRHLLHRRAAVPRIPEPLPVVQAGPDEDADGKTVGEHVGLSFYTLGQRKGIGMGGMKAEPATTTAASDAWYVARKDIASNTLYVVQGHDHPWLLSGTLRAGQASWVAGVPPDAGMLSAKTRYRQADVACRSRRRATTASRWTSTEPQWAVTPGQSAVLYDGDVCLGGGIIRDAGALSAA